VRAAPPGPLLLRITPEMKCVPAFHAGTRLSSLRWGAILRILRSVQLPKIHSMRDAK
jgi:hypothetical protein